MSTSSIDFLRITINLGGNKATIREMLQLFLKSTAEQLVQLEAAIAAQHMAECAAILHKIKGGAQNMSAARLAELCNEAEELSASGASLAANYEAIDHEFSLLKTVIDQHLAQLN